MKNKIKDEDNLLFLKRKKGILVYGILRVVLFGKRLYTSVGYVGKIVYDMQERDYKFKLDIGVTALGIPTMKLIIEKVEQLKKKHNLI